MFDITLWLTVATLLLVAVTWITDFFQWRSIRSVDHFLSGSRDIGTQLGEWLLARPEGKDAENKEFPTNLEACATMVGRQMYTSVSMAAKGVLSGESRTLRGVEKAVLEGIQTPETKALLGFCDEIGVNRELAGSVWQVLESRGLLPQFLKNNGSFQGGESSVW